MKRLIAAVIVGLMVGVTSSAAMASPGQLVNTSFETGLSGWTINFPARASVVTSYGTFVPEHGNYFALLTTDGPGSYTTLSQTFSADAGNKISGRSFFKANDVMPYNDFCRVRIIQGSTVVAPLFFANVSGGTTPWIRWEYAFTTPGVYTLEVQIMNMGSSTGDSVIGLDFIVFGVRIDIKPGSDLNSINLKSKGVIPVAILSTPSFDATTVAGCHVKFLDADPVHDLSDPLVVDEHQQDVDGDGDIDYVFHFHTQDIVIPMPQPPMPLPMLQGTTYDGCLISGIDSINIVPPQ